MLLSEPIWKLKNVDEYDARAEKLWKVFILEEVVRELLIIFEIMVIIMFQRVMD